MDISVLCDERPDLVGWRFAPLVPAPKNRVEIARTAAEGLEQGTVELPDVILLDLRLPDQSGLETLRNLRQIDSRITVIFVTAVRSPDSSIWVTRPTAYDNFLKTIDLQ